MSAWQIASGFAEGLGQHSPGNRHFVSHDHADSGVEFRGAAVLENIAGASGFQHSQQIHAVFRDGPRQQFHARVLSQEAPSGICSIEPRHLNVEEDHGRAEPSSGGDSISSGARFPDIEQVFGIFQDRAGSDSGQTAIVDNKNRYGVNIVGRGHPLVSLQGHFPHLRMGATIPPVGRSGGPTRVVGEPASSAVASRWAPIATVGLLGIVAYLAAQYPDLSLTPARAVEILFVCLVTVFLSTYLVPIKFGSLRLAMIGAQTAGLLFSPAEAGLVGLVAGLTRLRLGPQGGRYFGIVAPVLWTAAGSVLRVTVLRRTGNDLLALSTVPITVTLLNWGLTGLEFRLITGESILLVLRRNFDWSWAAAFGYFALCAILIAGVLDGTPKGYLLASIAAYLSTTLTVSIRERRRRLALEVHVRDNERYLAYVRAAEGLVHRLRNEAALSKGYLEEILASRAQQSTHRRATAAKGSVDSVLDALNGLASALTAGSSKVSGSVNVDQLVETSIEVIRPIARERKVELLRRRGYRSVWIEGDEHLLRDVLENLLLNAIEASSDGGRVTVSVRLNKNLVEIRVIDTGPGISDEMRERLFEPHLTTKLTGTGMGLFTSYGVVREHQGKLLYEGTADGAVFVVQLPVAAAAGVARATVAKGEGRPIQPSLASTKR